MVKRQQFRLDSGTQVTRVRPVRGGRSNYVYMGSLGNHTRVVIKLARVPGDSLGREARVLTALHEAGFACPSLVEAGTISSGGAVRSCLLLEHIDGTPPRSLSSWRRFGSRLAGLHGLRLPPGILPERDLTAQGLWNDLRPVVRAAGEATGSRLAAENLLERGVLLAAESSGSPVTAHGDAGPGNFLDLASGGMLVDFESACLQPRAADLGRCIFLVSAEGSVVSPALAARQLLDGYGDPGLGDQPHLALWSSLEGLRIAGWRFAHRHLPSTPCWRTALEQALGQLAQAIRRRDATC